MAGQQQGAGQRYGDAPVFDPNDPIITLSLWRASFDGYCDCNEIPAEPQNAEQLYYVEANLRRRLFIRALGKHQEAALRLHMWPIQPEQRPIPLLMQTLRRQYEPQELVETHRYLFDQLVQGSDQSVFEFINQLHAAAAKAQFGDSANERLKSRFIAGLRNVETKSKLLSTANLTWDQAKTIALQDEAVRNQIKAMAAAVPAAVNYVRKKSSSAGASSFKRDSKPPSGSSGSANSPSGTSSSAATAGSVKWGPCHRCNAKHDVNTCKFKDAVCHKCGKKGHIKPACLKGSKPKQKLNHVSDSTSPNPPVLVSPVINGSSVVFEVDSGAESTLMSEQQFQQLFPLVTIQPSSLEQFSPGGEVHVLGEASMEVKYLDKSFSLSMVVVEPSLTYPLIGRTWLDSLFPGWRDIFSPRVQVANVEPVPSMSQLRALYPHAFSDDPNQCILGFQAQLVLKPNATPVKHCAYRLPFGQVDPVNVILDAWESSGKAIRVRHAEWASPGLPIPKKDGTLRYCVDFKKTLNPQLRVDHYPLPTPEDVFASLAGASYFTSLDLKDAYTQLKLHPDSQDLCIVNTHRGFYKLTRLVYGVASAAGIFQSVMDEILQNIPGVICYLDNILIQGHSLSECVHRTHLVIGKLDKHHVKLREDKCDIFVQELEYLGFKISKQGRSPSSALTSAIVNFPKPTDAKLVKTFLSTANFYHHFIPQFASVAKPLRVLTEPDKEFHWTSDCDTAFQQCKDLLVSNDLLIHFDPKLPIVVYADASPYGVGSVLCHTVKVQGKPLDRPVMFNSCTLTPTQQRYAQVDREGLAVIFAVTKYRRYLWGRPFVLFTDCQAIQRILHPDKSLPLRTNHRLQHWAAILQAYQYSLVHRPSAQLAVADALSRSPCEGSLQEVNSVKILTPLPLDSAKIALETVKDPTLSRVLQLVSLGWPPRETFKNNPALRVFYNVRDSLSRSGNCVLFASRVVIPSSLRKEVLSLLHDGHPGVVRSKLLARTAVWWPDLNTDIENLCHLCSACALVNFKPVKEYIPWPPAKTPFQRVHVDFYEKGRKSFIILVDAYSKWVEICLLTDTTASAVIQFLLRVFSCFGLPSILVADNGQPFDSNDFVAFCTSYNIQVLHSPAYTPEANGQVERYVDIAKKGMEKMLLQASKEGVNSSLLDDPTYLSSLLCKFLFNFRNTPSTVTMKAPVELLFGYKPRTLLSALLPSAVKPSSQLREGEKVVFKLNQRSPTVEAYIVQVLGQNRYLISFHGIQREASGNHLSRPTVRL